MTEKQSVSSSIWDVESEKLLNVMRVELRRKHWTRPYVYEFLSDIFRGRHFSWLDVGIRGMVDYENLGKLGLSFTYTGVDISEYALKDCMEHLQKEDDRVLLWNIEENPGEELERMKGSYDLVTARHVINHCEYYESPLEKLSAMLKDGGIFICVLHLHLVDGKDRINKIISKKVDAEYHDNNYNKERFLSYIHKHLKIEKVIRFDDGIKPNDMIIAHKRSAAESEGIIPDMAVLRKPIESEDGKSFDWAPSFVKALIPIPVKEKIKKLLR